jgi:hypothetical protein
VSFVSGELSFRGKRRQCWGSASIQHVGIEALDIASKNAMAACMQLFPQLVELLGKHGIRSVSNSASTPNSLCSAPTPGNRSHCGSFRKAHSDSFRKAHSDSFHKRNAGKPVNDAPQNNVQRFAGDHSNGCVRPEPLYSHVEAYAAVTAQSKSK